MKRNVQAFSDRYLVRILEKSDMDAVFELYQGNPQYFASFREPTVPDRARTEEDRTALPPGKTAADKRFAGFFDGETLLAVLDLIDGYPQEDTAYVGLFLLRRDCQGKGEGTRIFSGVCAALEQEGFARIRLAILKDNAQAQAFWKKNGFSVVEEAERGKEAFLLAEKILKTGENRKI